MQVDYGLLVTVKEILSQDENLQSAGIAKSIYFEMPVRTKFPLILLDIDEIWEDNTALSHEAQARINFRVIVMSQMVTIKESLAISSCIEQAMNGISLRLSDTHLANLRKTGNVIDMPLIQNPRSVQQFYQAVVWQKSMDQFG
jgi:hypothetical protein